MNISDQADLCLKNLIQKTKEDLGQTPDLPTGKIKLFFVMFIRGKQSNVTSERVNDFGHNTIKNIVSGVDKKDKDYVGNLLSELQSLCPEHYL